MNAVILLAAATLGQCGAYTPQCPTWSQPANRTPWFYQWVYIPPSPWNAAVVELRARGPARSRDRFGGLPEATQRNLRDLSVTVDELYATLRSAPRHDKDALRAQWLAARAAMERARLLASRELP